MFTIWGGGLSANPSSPTLEIQFCPDIESAKLITRAANLSLSKKVLLSLKITSIFAGRARITSAKPFRPGSRARLKALEAHGFRCSLVQS